VTGDDSNRALNADPDTKAFPPGSPVPVAGAWRGWVSWGLGVVLLGAAVWAVSRHSDDLASAVESARTAPALAWAGLLVLPMVNWVLTAGVFWVLTRRFGRVGTAEMAALIGVSWLLNYLPLKPGLIGRVAYHRVVNGIPVPASLRVLVESLVVSGAAYLGVLLAVWGWSSGALAAVAGSAGGLIVALTGLLPCIRSRSTLGTDVQHAAAAAVLRLVDLAVWTARYALVFWMIGLELPVSSCVVVAVAGQLASLIPVAFGVREWAVGLVGGRLLAEAGQRALIGAAISADLVNRVAEVVAAVPVGLISARVLRGRMDLRPAGPQE
jgi:hypothetical protein